jgi:hypothetical protein
VRGVRGLIRVFDALTVCGIPCGSGGVPLGLDFDDKCSTEQRTSARNSVSSEDMRCAKELARFARDAVDDSLPKPPERTLGTVVASSRTVDTSRHEYISCVCSWTEEDVRNWLRVVVGPKAYVDGIRFTGRSLYKFHLHPESSGLAKALTDLTKLDEAAVVEAVRDLRNNYKKAATVQRVPEKSGGELESPHLSKVWMLVVPRRCHSKFSHGICGSC